MNLRNVTIWTTGVMPILAMVACTILVFNDDYFAKTPDIIVVILVFWAFSSWPLMFISCAIAQKLQSNWAHAVLFVATIIHAGAIVIAYTGLWSMWIKMPYISIASLVAMCFVWIALIPNRR